MLKKLHIKNFALVKELEFYPYDGLNIITGETGAGKSIILNSLGLILGQRADLEFLRHGENRLVVEASFDITPAIIKFLTDKDIDYGDSEILIRREITDNGKSRAFVNDSLIKLSDLQELGDILIDFHGQHAHQSLFKKELHLQILDRFAEINLIAYSEDLARYRHLNRELNLYRTQEKTKREELELATYHLKELQQASIRSGEEEEILVELTRMEGIEELKKRASNIENLVYQDECSILSNLSNLQSELQKFLKFKPELEPFTTDLEAAIITIKELSNQISLSAAGAEFDEDDYRRAGDRLSLIKQLKKKFGPSIEELLLYQQKLETLLVDGVDFESKIYNLEKELKAITEELSVKGEKISRQRKIAAEHFCQQINQEFMTLGLKNARFQINFTPNESFEDFGLESLEFYVATNIGSDFTPLIKTASGGEISRIMLAIKSIISQKEEVNILVFDEIDTGISGAVAEMVGLKIEELAKEKQIFVITHLPVIACRGKNHFLVKKEVINSSTETSLKNLSHEERVNEIAAMIGGHNFSNSTRLGALELLEKS